MRNARLRLITLALLALGALLSPASPARAQGVTTGALGGVVANAQGQPVAGATVVAIHLPSGTSYETETRADGRFSMPGMRVGGPYTVTVAYTGGGSGAAFEPQTKEDISVTLGLMADVNFSVKTIAITESVTVTAVIDPVFSSSRTGAATSVNRSDIAILPTVSARISDITRLTPQASGNSFAGQDNRLNNITVDGSYFNNSFGLGGQPGDRTNVAPISLESIEQIQVSVAPFDVRQGNFIGAAVNTVTRSGTNAFTASVYHRMRNDGFVGKEARGLTFNPGDFTFRNTGVWGGGPVIKNKLFVFGNYENELDKRPLHTFRANAGGEAVGGSVTRVLASDLNTLSGFLSRSFNYNTGGFENINDETPAKRYLLRTDYNLSKNHKVSFRYNQLDSSTDVNISGSTSAGLGRGTFTTGYLGFETSNYSILENIKSGIGEWNGIFGNSLSNSLIAGYTTSDESRGGLEKLFPFVDILAADGTAYTSFGSEPFTPNNELRYNTFQLKDDVTKYSQKHALTFGGTLQRYESENVFYPISQSAYTYNSLQDFYTDAADALANPSRTTSPITLRRFQVRYMNIPGVDKPVQPLKVWYGGAYAQDEWRARKDLTVMAGLRFDVPAFENTAYQNPKADALTFRDETGASVQYSTGRMPGRNILWSPRASINWDLGGAQTTQVRAGTGVFTGPPLYVWISNQIGNTGVLTGFEQVDNTLARPFSPEPNRYKPTSVTGAGAASFELNVTDPDFKFPQVWRTNLALDRRLPWGITSTSEFIYNRDVNGIYYINANLPAAQTAFTGVDNRARYTANRINNTTPNIITAAIVMKNQSVGRSWNLSQMFARDNFHGLSVKGAYSYGESKNTIDPGSTAFASWTSSQTLSDPNNPGLGISNATQGHRVFVQATYTRQYFKMGGTTVSAFWEASPSRPSFSTTASYAFGGDANGDGAPGNDLIYVPRDTSEMNFVAFTSGGRTFTAAEQSAAFDAFIRQDKYLSSRRGQYAERGGVTYPVLRRMDLSLVQDVFKNVGGKRNSGQFRLDIQNFGNLLNSDWGVSSRSVAPITGANSIQILTNAAADAQGRLSYRMAVVGGELVSKSFQSSAQLSDVYQVMLSFRYSFN